jgi:small subunit ribosomal protein S13
MAAPNQQKQEPKKSLRDDHESEETLVRVAGFDLPGSKKIYPALTRIKGVSWAISNATCIILKMPRNKKVSELSKPEIEKIEKFLKNPEVQDLETGKTNHFIGNDLDMKKDFDIRRLKKIRSYKGVRHTANLPVRGQRTRAHFRKKGQAVSVQKKGAKGKKA